PDGRLLAAASGRRILLYHIDSRDLTAQFDCDRNIRDIAFSPDGRVLASADGAGRLALWDVAVSGESAVWNEPATVRALAVSPDGGTVASAAGYLRQGRMEDVAHITLRDRRTGAIRHRLEGHERAVSSVDYSPDGKLLASTGNDWTVRLWNPESGELLRVLYRHGRAGDRVVFSRDGTRLAAIFPGIVKVWDTGTWSLAGNLEVDPSESRWHSPGLEFGPEGRFLYSGGGDSRLRKWELASGKQVAVLDVHSNNVRDLRIDPDGRWLIS
ncbi:MAG: hypothetical protein GWO24_17160, partial [Akkermansiaceae bacterium]|nr:hypothetical protein [Akkermansiaceae bacterium]